MYLRLKFQVVLGKFLAFETILMIIYIAHQNSLKPAFNPGFSVHNNHLNLFGHMSILNGYCVVKKQVLNVVYLRILMY